MNKRDIKVGMRVRVKSWEKMLKGVGVKIEDNGIKFPQTDVIFNFEMKNLCGKTAVVEKIDERIKLDFGDNVMGTPYLWSYIPQMLEPVEEEKEQAGVIFKEELFEPKTFTKEDLTLGMVAELRNGYICIVDGEGCVSREQELKLRYLRDLHGIASLNNYRDNLVHEYYGRDYEFDIMKVYEDYTMKNILWERKEIELSEREIEVLKALKTLGYRTLIRNEDNQYVHACNGKDYIEKVYYFWKGLGRIYELSDKTLFKFVKWEDEKPYSIEELLSYES